MSTLKNTGFWYFFADSAVFLYFCRRYLTNDNSKSYFGRTQEDISGALKCFIQTVTNFCCHQQKIQKRAIFDILMTITLEVNMITRQMTPCFIYYFGTLYVGIYHFRILRPSKFNFMPPFVLCSSL